MNNAADTLLRSARTSADDSAADRSEITRLLTRDDLQTDDKAYLASRVAAQTGVSSEEAQRRVNAALTSVREAADKARKASSALGFFTALSMLIGAFIASVAAAYGGHQRDEHADLI